MGRVLGDRGRAALRSFAGVAGALSVLSLALPLVDTAAGASPIVTAVGPNSYGQVVAGTGPDAGNIYINDYLNGDVYQVSPNGTETVLASFGVDTAWGLTDDSQGNLYVGIWETSDIYKISPSDVVTLYTSSAPAQTYSLVFDSANGILYDGSVSANVYQIASNGTTTLFSSDGGNYSLAQDAAGNLYSVDFSGTVQKITPNGAVSTYAIDPNPAGFSGVAVGPSGDLYLIDNQHGQVVRLTPNGQFSVILSPTDFVPTAAELWEEAFDAQGNLYVTDWGNREVYLVRGVDYGQTPVNLVVNESSSGTVSASWYGPSGVVSYTCTLMYGFDNPSSVTEVTTTPSCTFAGLNPTVGYGVEVVANNGGAASAPAVAFATPAPAPVTPPPVKRTIVCKKYHKTALKTVTGVHPTCPAGWHRVA